MSMGKRVRERLEEMGWSQSLLARRAGISQSGINKICQDQVSETRKLGVVAHALGLRPEWILTGVGPRTLLDADPEPSKGPNVRSWVPLISWVQAGSFCDAPDLYEPGCGEAMLPVPRVVGPNAYALRVEGDSMVSPYPGTRSYPPGTIIYVEPDKSPVSGDKVIAKTGDGQVTFKQYKTDGGSHILVPLNPQFPTITMTNEMTICGVIVGAYWDE